MFHIYQRVNAPCKNNGILKNSRRVQNLVQQEADTRIQYQNSNGIPNALGINPTLAGDRGFQGLGLRNSQGEEQSSVKSMAAFATGGKTRQETKYFHKKESENVLGFSLLVCWFLTKVSCLPCHLFGYRSQQIWGCDTCKCGHQDAWRFRCSQMQEDRLDEKKDPGFGSKGTWTQDWKFQCKHLFGHFYHKFPNLKLNWLVNCAPFWSINLRSGVGAPPKPHLSSRKFRHKITELVANPGVDRISHMSVALSGFSWHVKIRIWAFLIPTRIWSCSFHTLSSSSSFRFILKELLLKSERPGVRTPSIGTNNADADDN